MRFIILPLVVLYLVNGHYIQSWIDKHSDGLESYVANVAIGTPSIYYKLHISFIHTKLFMWNDLSTKSVSYSRELGGTDFVFIGSSYYRVPVSINTTTRQDFSNSGCFDCVGVLGLGTGSALTFLFSEMSVSRSSITLGKLGDEIGWNSRETLAVLSCQDVPGLCVTHGHITTRESSLEMERIVFDPATQDITLSPRVYDSYMSGKNLYADPVSSWEHLEFEIGAMVEYESLEHMKYGLEKIKTRYGLEDSSYVEHLKFSIQPEHLIQSTSQGGKRMLIKRGNTDETRLGTEVLKHMIFHKMTDGNMILVQLFETNDHISNANLIMFLVLLFLLARWMITHISVFYNDEIHAKRSLIELGYEITGMALSIAAYVLPSTLSLLETHMSLYIGTGIMVGFSFIWNSVELGFDISNRIKKRERLLFFGSDFEANMARVFSHEILLLTGLWILLLERRLEGVADILVLFVNIILVFVMSFHLVVMLHYTVFSFFFEPMRTRQGSPIGKFFSFFVMSLCIFAYQSLVTVNFFLRPLFVKNYETYETLIVPGLVFLYMFLLTAASFLASMFVGHAREKLKEQ